MIVLDPVLGFINHSCDPNAYVVMDGPTVSVRTLRPIKHDEEVFISYVDTTNPVSRRHVELMSRWFFDCKCEKCQNGAATDEDSWAGKANQMGQETKDMADVIIRRDPSAIDRNNITTLSRDEQRVTAIEREVFSIYDGEQSSRDSADAIKVIQQAMQICHLSGLWPLHRQPYAALRDDLIVNLLSEGEYHIAWMHSARRYKYITPKLYPIPSHPVRVVQTWQMAMLAAYHASVEEGIRVEGANMGLIAMMLVKQVLDAAVSSHGPHTSFTQSVREKAEEMVEELKRHIGNADKEVMDRELEIQRNVLSQMGDLIKM